MLHLHFHIVSARRGLDTVSTNHAYVVVVYIIVQVCFTNIVKNLWRGGLQLWELVTNKLATRDKGFVDRA